MNVTRRLKPLEARASSVSAVYSHSVLIEFVDPDRRVVRTLLMENGRQVWTHLEQDNESGPQTITSA